MIALDLSLPAELRHRELDDPESDYLDEMTPPASPELIWIPAQPSAPRARQVNLELWPDPSGQRALLAYTSPAQLRAACGPHQAFVSIHAADLRKVAREAGAQTVLFNPVLDERSRQAARDQVAPPSRDDSDGEYTFLWKA